MNDLFIVEKNFDAKVEQLLNESKAFGMDVEKITKPLNDFSMNSLPTKGTFENYEMVKGNFQHYKLTCGNHKISLSNILARVIFNESDLKFRANKNGHAMLTDLTPVNAKLYEFSKGKSQVEMIAFLLGKSFTAKPIKAFEYFANKENGYTVEFFNGLNSVDLLGYIPLKQYYQIELIESTETESVETESAKPKK